MKNASLSFMMLLFVCINVFGQNSDSCKQQFNTLLKIEQKEKVSESDLKRSWEITKELYNENYTNYIDSIENKTKYISHSLTRTYSNICRKADSGLSVEYYLKYMELTMGSAEEELSFSLERLFVKYPKTVLDKIGRNKYFLSSLTWGFLNNRYYGADNPYEHEDYTAMTVYENEPKPVLNAENCEDIFYKTNPSLLGNYEKYKFQIDYIINNAKLELSYESE